MARFLGADELAQLGRARDKHDARWPEGLVAVRLLALTGCRRSEVLNLSWRNISEVALNLEDPKTGLRAVVLGESARVHIAARPGTRDPGKFLCSRASPKVGTPYNLAACWRTACEGATLGSLRLHDLRHPAASQAVMSGENLPLVGKLLGHRRHRTTEGYAHIEDAHLLEAAKNSEPPSQLATAMW